MASFTSVLVAYLLVTCLLGAQINPTNGAELGGSQDTSKSHSQGDMVHLLRLSIRDIYARSARMLKQELGHSLAVLDGALRGDMGPVKRDSTGTGTTSLGSGPLYFLARGLDISEPSTTFDDNVELNERLFDIAGK